MITMSSKASCSCARTQARRPRWPAFTRAVRRLNEQILPKGVKIVPYLDRDDLVDFTTHTVLHNLAEGMLLVVIVLFIFLGNIRGAIIVALTIPFSLLFASICLDLRHISANLLSLGALDFGMVVDGAVVMVENIVRHLNRRDAGPRTIVERIRTAAHEVQRPVFYAIAIIITAYLPIFTLQRVEGKLFRPMAWTVAFALLGALLFSMLVAPALASVSVQKECETVAQPRNGISHSTLQKRRHSGRTLALAYSRRCPNFVCRHHLPGFQRSDRLRVSAASR